MLFCIKHTVAHIHLFTSLNCGFLIIMHVFFCFRIFTGSTRLDGNAIGEFSYILFSSSCFKDRYISVIFDCYDSFCPCKAPLFFAHCQHLVSICQLILCAGCVLCPWMSWPRPHTHVCSACRK